MKTIFGALRRIPTPTSFTKDLGDCIFFSFSRRNDMKPIFLHNCTYSNVQNEHFQEEMEGRREEGEEDGLGERGGAEGKEGGEEIGDVSEEGNEGGGGWTGCRICAVLNLSLKNLPAIILAFLLPGMIDCLVDKLPPRLSEAFGIFSHVEIRMAIGLLPYFRGHKSTMLILWILADASGSRKSLGSLKLEVGFANSKCASFIFYSADPHNSMPNSC